MRATHLSDLQQMQESGALSQEADADIRALSLIAILITWHNELNT